MIESMNRTLCKHMSRFGRAPLVSTFRTRLHKYARGYRLLWHHLRRGVVLDLGSLVVNAGAMFDIDSMTPR